MARLQLKLEFRLHANLALLIILDGNINFHQQEHTTYLHVKENRKKVTDLAL